MRDDPEASYSPLMLRGFQKYLRFYFRSGFHGVRVSREDLPCLDPARPAIVFTNHPSWWDPVMLIFIAQTYFPDRRNFGAMDADALAQYGVMRRLGAFAVPKGLSGAIAFREIAERILQNPAHTLFVTAQGKFADNRAPLALMPGIAHLARRVPHADLVPLALDYPFWNESKPEALVRFGPRIAADPTLSVAAWTERLTRALAATLAALTEDAIARDPARFVTLIGTRGGVGGPYDWFRRAKSLARGRAFDPSHEA